MNHNVPKQSRTILFVLLLLCLPALLQAQMAEGKSKFLGNIHYQGIIPLNFDQYWNQVTPENSGKWPSCEQSRDDMNYWLWLDRAYEEGIFFSF